MSARAFVSLRCSAMSAYGKTQSAEQRHAYRAGVAAARREDWLQLARDARAEGRHELVGQRVHFAKLQNRYLISHLRAMRIWGAK